MYFHFKCKCMICKSVVDGTSEQILYNVKGLNGFARVLLHSAQYRMTRNDIVESIVGVSVCVLKGVGGGEVTS